ncbi:MAG: hypothetical protein WD995_05620 [Gemmatimonadota bacterium]
MRHPEPMETSTSGGRSHRRWLGTLALCATLSLLSVVPLAAQDGCTFGEEGNDVLRQVTLPGGEAIYYVTRPHLVCEEGIQIWADSAVAFTTSNMAHLIGSVRYEDPRRSLVSDEARYFSAVGRLQAEGGLRIEDRDEGSVVENGALVYLRETSFRDEESMTVTTGADRVRPRATMSAEAPEADSSAVEAAGSEEPRIYVVEGDEILSRGGNYLRSVGAVELTFDSVVAFADTLEYREATDDMELRGGASVNAPEYTLTGARIDLTTPTPQQREIRALREAVLTGNDLVLTAERIFLFAREEQLQRLVALPPETDSTLTAPDSASPPTRPHAVADEFEITADSLDILAPAETLERIFAAGRARSVSHARDSLNVEILPEAARSDWLEGDTIIVTFVPGAEETPDDDTEPRAGAMVERIVAIVAARSLYRMTPSDASALAGEDPPAVHYVVGDRITIVMRDGEVDRMEVEGAATGFHLEPLRPGPES